MLERLVLERMLADALPPRLRDLDVDAVRVTSRELSGVGFFTALDRTPETKLFADDVSLRWGRVGARLNDGAFDTGYLAFVDDGFLTMLEGYTYEDAWPDEVQSIELYELPAQSTTNDVS